MFSQRLTMFRKKVRTEKYLTIACQISYSFTIKIFKFGIEEHMTSAVIHLKNRYSFREQIICCSPILNEVLGSSEF